MNKQTISRLILFGILLGIILTSCSLNTPIRSDKLSNSTQLRSQLSDATSIVHLGTIETPRIINIVAYQFGFEPSEISVQQGETVTINLKSRDVGHSFTVRDLGINVKTFPDNPGSQTVTINASTGVYGAQCRVECGSGHKTMMARVVVQ